MSRKWCGSRCWITGIGIPPEQIPFIFDEFFQVGVGGEQPHCENRAAAARRPLRHVRMDSHRKRMETSQKPDSEDSRVNAHVASQSSRRDDRSSYPFTLPITPIDWTWDSPREQPRGNSERCRDSRSGWATDSQSKAALALRHGLASSSILGMHKTCR